jgi:glycosyltransferase involved in cell wall biosynthesis
MTRVLFFGDAAATGFGSVTMDLGRALLARGLDVRFVSQNDLPGDLPEPFRSRTVDLASFVMGSDGVESMREFIPAILRGDSEVAMADGKGWERWKPDAAILLGDFAAARIFTRPYMAEFAAIPTFHYVPVEGVDLPPKWAELWQVIHPVAMSRFGQVEVAKVTGTIPPLAYHGVDTATFHPVTPSTPIVIEGDDGKRDVLTSKEACKAWFGINPKARVLLRTDRNMPRKRYGSLFRALGPVLEERRDTCLVIHCGAYDQGGYLFDSISKLPLAVQQQVRVSDTRGIPRTVLAALYNAADLYVSTSAEGFGLTIAEAVACGVPAVGLDYSAVPEVVGPAGVTVPPAFLYDNEYDHYWAQPDEAAFGRAVGYLLDHASKRRALGAEGPRHVARNFTWDGCADTFQSVILEAVGRKAQADRVAAPPESEDFVFVPVESAA